MRKNKDEYLNFPVEEWRRIANDLEKPDRWWHGWEFFLLTVSLALIALTAAAAVAWAQG